MYTHSIVPFLKMIHFHLTLLHHEKICVEIKLTLFELKCTYTQRLIVVKPYIYADFQIHILTELTAVTTSVHDNEKALESPAIFLGHPAGFVAFKLSAVLQGSVLWPCHLDFVRMTLAVATENSQLSHAYGVNCICRLGVLQAQVPSLK